MNRPLWLVALPATILAVQASAETAYVTDRLRLGVHVAADTNDRAFTFLDSGDAVEILQRNGAVVQVRLTDGREGWVRGAFLLDEEPAVIRLSRLTVERDRLAAELEAREGSGAERTAAAEQLRATALQATRRAESAQQDLASLRRQNRELRAVAERSGHRVPVAWLLIASLVTLLLGAIMAWRWFDRSSRRRHGGFRIY